VILHRKREPKCPDLREVLGVRNEGMFDDPVVLCKGRSFVRLPVAFENQIYRRITHGMRCCAPAGERRGAQRALVSRGIGSLYSAVSSAKAVRLLVRLTHQSAFKAAIDAELEADDSEPLVAFTRPNA